MTKGGPIPSHPGTGRPGAQRNQQQTIVAEDGVQVQRGGDQSKNPKKMKVFFTTMKDLLSKRAAQESRLQYLQGPQNKRKRANCLKVIMQINRAIKHGDKCIKSPEELTRKRIQEKIKRIAKKLEKKRILTLKKEVKEAERHYHQ